MNSKLFKLSTLVMSSMVINIYGIIKKCNFRQMLMPINATICYVERNRHRLTEVEFDKTKEMLYTLIADLADQRNPDSLDCPNYKEEELSITDNIEATLRFALTYLQNRSESDKDYLRNTLSRFN
jgi:hypothetical protein